jgi:hypothetical protein
MSARFEVTTDRFNEALKKFQSTSRRSKEVNARQQAKLLVLDFMGVTPPNKKFKWNRRAGEWAIKNDLKKLFKTSRAKKAETDLASVHLRNRNNKGRVPKGVQKVRAKGIIEYRKTVLAKVGQLAGGWNKAAAALGTARVPAWISRHSNQPGMAKVTVNAGKVEIEIANRAVYQGLKNWVERGVSAALKKRYWAMIKRVDFYQAKAAKDAGFAVT